MARSGELTRGRLAGVLDRIGLGLAGSLAGRVNLAGELAGRMGVTGRGLARGRKSGRGTGWDIKNLAGGLAGGCILQGVWQGGRDYNNVTSNWQGNWQEIYGNRSK